MCCKLVAMDSSVVTVFFLVLSNCQQETEAQFKRACDSYEDCVFSNENLATSSPFNDPSVSFACDIETGSCACRSATVLSNSKPLWDLSWNRSSEECQIGSNGPCGLDNGLRIHCGPGGEFNCVEGRCRQETQLRKLKEGRSCQESVECQVPLVCTMTLWHYFYTESKCLPELKVSRRVHPML